MLIASANLRMTGRCPLLEAGFRIARSTGQLARSSSGTDGRLRRKGSQSPRMTQSFATPRTAACFGLWKSRIGSFEQLSKAALPIILNEPGYRELHLADGCQYRLPSSWQSIATANLRCGGSSSGTFAVIARRLDIRAMTKLLDHLTRPRDEAW